MLWKANDAGATGAAAVANNGGVLTFEWVDRRTTLPVTTLTIFPEDGVTYKRVWTGGNDGGDDRAKDRVYCLQYGNNSDRRFFFWMQELTDVKDGEYARDINAYCSDTSGICAKKAREVAGDSATATGGGAAGAGGSVDSANLQAIMQGLTGGGAPAAASSGGASGDALSAIMQNLTSGASATPAPTGASATPNAPPRPEGSAATSAPGSAGGAAGNGGGAITRE